MSDAIAVRKLIELSETLLMKAGLDEDMSRTVASVLVEGELLGHATHGVRLLPDYLEEIASGAMSVSGVPEIIRDMPAVAVWDGNRLPGPWLVHRAIATASEKAGVCGTGTVVVRRSHHIACLAAYLEEPARNSRLIVLQSSDPSVAAVAPHGGTRGVMTPNPMAMGIPTGTDPILIDISTSNTTIAMARQAQRSKGRLPQKWLLDNRGIATDDPAVLDADPAGSLMLLGGIEAGHKGFGLSLMVESLTGGLAGFGRADGAIGWGATFIVQIYDLDLFGGAEAFKRQTDYLVDQTLQNPPRDSANPPRLPGHAGLHRKRSSLAQGVELPEALRENLSRWASRLGVTHLGVEPHS